MASSAPHERLTLIGTDPAAQTDGLAADVKAGLTQSPKRLSCRYFYDHEGSLLFEAICDLPEYYLTRAEREILLERAADIAARFPPAINLVELGSGSAAKTRILIEAFLRRHGTLCYVPVDISRKMLEESSLALLDEYPALKIIAISGEYHDGLRQLNAVVDGPKLILWLGSNVGNFERAEAAVFLGQVRDTMSASDRLLVGIDLRKDKTVLEAAYDDSQGITAQFNLNLLVRINRELGGHFDLNAFEHRAVYNEEIGRIEMYLVSTRAQRVSIDRLGLKISFDADELVHTENSYKYSLAEIAALANASGLHIEHQWLDGASRFSVNLLAPADD
jgi:dimethylhistidine N-methyltransferase